MRRRGLIIGILMLFCAGAWGAESKQQELKQPTKGLLFFYRSSRWVDNYLLNKIDTAYIGLPEHSWRLAFTSGMLGINSTLHSATPIGGYTSPMIMSLYNRTTPSVDLGFYVGYRSFGFGYSWDVLHAYDRRISFTLGSKFIGIDFSYQTSTNINTQLAVDDVLVPSLTSDNGVAITNTNLNIWYALNASHYSHHAAVKQSYIQRKSAGSILLHLSYMSSRIAFTDTIMIDGAYRPTFSSLMSEVNKMTTRQVAVGIGYGINYTPNHGKVLLHLSAAAMLVCYSVNHISYYMPDSVRVTLPGDPMYVLHPAQPVHVTGNVRAAVSWEINRWVHLSTWATGDNIRFNSEKTYNNNELFLSNWNWKVQLTVGVRLGAGSDRIQRALGTPQIVTNHPNHNHIKRWITDFFWSPK